MRHASCLVRNASRGLGFILMTAFGSSAFAATDCQLATQYDELAAKASAAFEDEAALGHAQRASELCPSYARWQALGESAMAFGDMSLDASCTGNDAPCKTGSVLAAEAFIAALGLASTNTEAAASIARYAQVLYYENDPQKANNYISQALKLDPGRPWIQALAEEIPRNMNTREALRAGLGDFKVPEMVLSSMRSLTALDSGAPPTNPAAEPEPAPPPPATVRTGAINVPLNFIVNTTQLDASSEPRLRDVVDILAEQPDRRYHIIGHADVTGNTRRNQQLSEQRAQSIYVLITTMAPSLRGRITHEGQGSSNPIRLGMTPEDHRANRRVEIYVR